MRILVFSQAAWNTANSFGNTVTNWFDGWENTHFFHFYARQQKPNTDIVEKYYNVSAVEILKKALRGKEPGRIIEPADAIGKETANEVNAEHEQIAQLHKKPNEFLYWGMELVWRTGKWINKKFEEFVKEADPDIIFAFATNPYILEPAIKYIKAMKPSVKIVLWIADDILTGFDHNAWYRRKYLKNGIDYCFSAADKVYGASVEMCEKYSQIYKKEVTPLYKGCTFDKPIKEISNCPLRMVYAGNLLYGRKGTLEEIITALRVINSMKCKAVLEVYSNTPIDEEEKQQWFDNTNAFYMGAHPYEDIKKTLNEADIVLHVESFEKDQMEKVKYSFSTKIIDCLQSGSVVLGIGPAHIASIEYLRGINGTTVIDEPKNILEGLYELVDEQKLLIDRASSTREYALENHDIHRVRHRMQKEFADLIGYGKSSGGLK